MTRFPEAYQKGKKEDAGSNCDTNHQTTNEDEQSHKEECETKETEDDLSEIPALITELEQPPSEQAPCVETQQNDHEDANK
jgi:hypothetical protein